MKQFVSSPFMDIPRSSVRSIRSWLPRILKGKELENSSCSSHSLSFRFRFVRRTNSLSLGILGCAWVGRWLGTHSGIPSPSKFLSSYRDIVIGA
ncbi:uncharacterized protein BO88DRAFT_60031 [Aspergillus vadensis CBS 113365]|uniref:Uncharacterized protein n=1 Tax=Aspergillus vadensis (strain CBS 113365 / IMI 142717 / IBT 24658) TaxID=1448311 RepID=A0A319B7S4_ASPVC|nr:hypothetical protein BO88DRAFT_60031 [Aspergillus vadensis CBS 113365]PYH68585.1 hypothetical protein BO88DRAFT_60031 [Aspergillus vadensis CBS 113365]